jgi:hypothetical protein
LEQQWSTSGLSGADRRVTSIAPSSAVPAWRIAPIRTRPGA